MCRLLAYFGAPVLMRDLLISPEASLVSQSVAAREAKTVVNGDGCGVGWYGEFETPGVFKDTRPAWADANFASLCGQIRSRLFLAHVRSATSGEVSRSNTHPFVLGRHLFMHNGQIGGYDRIRRRLDHLIPDRLYAHRSGTSDSEAIFLLAYHLGLVAAPIPALARALRLCRTLMDEHEISAALRFSAVVSDGADVIAVRWSSDDSAPSLYSRALPSGVAIASEPFSFDDGPWSIIPPGQAVRVHAGGIEVFPFDPMTIDPLEA